jgi:cellulose synthase/poly-beta-1,6-N-acetylglucosamine synthase-like glycosyltransferase
VHSVFPTRRRGGSTRAPDFYAAAIDPSQAQRLLDEAVFGLRRRSPELSAFTPLWRWQKRTLAAALVLLCGGALLAPETTLIILLAILAFPFLCVVVLRAMALQQLLSPTGRHEHPLPLPDTALPSYSVLVPLYREAGVVPQLLAALRALDYPRDRLEIFLIVEEADSETRGALRPAMLEDCMRVLVVPTGAPQTKPRAVQYALQVAAGELVVIYDAEDIPERDQLRLAAAAMAAGGEKLVCLQAHLNIYNTDASWLTRQFTIEYTALFDCILPTLERLRLPVPLGGTSNHFRRRVLEEVGGWDPYNVTEDADLGIRLARSGWQVGVVDSTTWEEAPPTFGIWKGQRTRWLKGWIQTYLVHLREPGRLRRELGTRRFIGLQVLMGGLILSALVHPWFYLIVAHDIWQGRLLALPPTAFGKWLLGIGIFNLVAGYASAMALGAVAVARRGHARLALQGLLTPVYWLGVSFAAYRALYQLARDPYFWEKTEHGTGRAGASQAPQASPSPTKKRSASLEMDWRVSK